MNAQNAETQAQITPQRAVQLLTEGNQRFVAGQPAARDLLAQMQATRGGQWPFAAVLSCIDSRVSAELVFDQGIGDIFSARIAGNVATDELLGSLEFACKVAGAKVVVVLGHSHCGAVKGACDGVEMSHLTTLLEHIRPAVDATEGPADASARTSQNPAFVQSVAERNVRMVVEHIAAASPVLGEMRAEGEIAIVGAMYDIETGEVSILA